MTYVAILRSVDASDAAVTGRERQIVARICEECRAARWIASGAATGSACLDVFDAPDEATAIEIVAIARAPGLTEPVRCSAMPWELFAKDPE